MLTKIDKLGDNLFLVTPSFWSTWMWNKQKRIADALIEIQAVKIITSVIGTKWNESFLVCTMDKGEVK